MRYSNQKTLERYKKMKQLYMNPKTEIISYQTNIHRTSLSLFANERQELTPENLERLNIWLDEKLSVFEKV